MALVKGSVTMSAANTLTVATIDTNLLVDGKTGWEIRGFLGYASTLEVQVLADIEASLVLATIPTITTMDMEDEVARCAWQIMVTGAVDAAIYVPDGIKQAVMIQPRVTVQPQIYVQAVTTGYTNPGTFYWMLEYEPVKLTDIELLRLLVGGA